MRRARYRLVVDPIACDGAGVCAELFPEMLSLDPWGYPIIRSDEVPDGMLELARKATVNCPRLALTLIKIDK